MLLPTFTSIALSSCGKKDTPHTPPQMMLSQPPKKSLISTPLCARWDVMCSFLKLSVILNYFCLVRLLQYLWVFFTSSHHTPFFLASNALSSSHFLTLCHVLPTLFLLPSFLSFFYFSVSSPLPAFFSLINAGHVSHANSKRKKVSIWTICRRWWHVHHWGLDAERMGSAIRY